ncbi:MAG TPA: hypothetical protein VFX79_00015 [Candidatus Saccharimonadales bacterium]|nr:hypothetical protein [Candidatus Saccharimonadales bacterium]
MSSYEFGPCDRSEYSDGIRNNLFVEENELQASRIYTFMSILRGGGHKYPAKIGEVRPISRAFWMYEVDFKILGERGEELAESKSLFNSGFYLRERPQQESPGKLVVPTLKLPRMIGGPEEEVYTGYFRDAKTDGLPDPAEEASAELGLPLAEELEHSRELQPIAA